MGKITSVSDNLIKLIERYEGFSAKPYKCPAGKWTIGLGSTFYFDTKKSVTQNDKPITHDEAVRLAKGHINSIFAPLCDKLCKDDLNQNQFDAVVDFLYNAGATYKDSNGKQQYYKLFKHINSNMSEKDLTIYWQKLCITGGGKPLNGLIKRRAEEVSLFFKK
jgi:lysozyme